MKVMWKKIKRGERPRFLPLLYCHYQFLLLRLLEITLSQTRTESLGFIGGPIGLGPKDLPAGAFAGGIGLFLIARSLLVLLQPNRLRIRMLGWRPAWQWAPPEALSAGFPPSHGRCR